jgi:hypothetical protein
MIATTTVAARLNELRYLQLQEARMIDVALQRMSDSSLAAEFEHLREEHELHAAQLSRMLDEAGADEADPGHEFMAFVQAQLRLIEEARDQAELFERLLLAERGSAAEYTRAPCDDLPERFVADLEDQAADELRHVTFIEGLAPPPPDSRGDGGGPGVARAGRVVTTPGTGVGHGPWTGPEGPIGQTDPDLIDEEPSD